MFPSAVSSAITGSTNSMRLAKPDAFTSSPVGFVGNPRLTSVSPAGCTAAEGDAALKGFGKLDRSAPGTLTIILLPSEPIRVSVFSLPK